MLTINWIGVWWDLGRSREIWEPQRGASASRFAAGLDGHREVFPHLELSPICACEISASLGRAGKPYPRPAEPALVVTAD